MKQGNSNVIIIKKKHKNKNYNIYLIPYKNKKSRIYIQDSSNEFGNIYYVEYTMQELDEDKLKSLTDFEIEKWATTCDAYDKINEGIDKMIELEGSQY